MLNLYTLPDRVKMYVGTYEYVPQAQVQFIHYQLKKLLGINGQMSHQGVAWKDDDCQYYYKTSDNTLFIEWNPIRKVAQELSRKGLYEGRRGYGERENYIHSEGLNNFDLEVLPKHIYENFSDERFNLEMLFERLLKDAFDIQLGYGETYCKLFKLEVAQDLYSPDAPDEILNLHRGFMANHFVCSPFPDQQLRGIYAQIQKRDGTYGTKTARMYLKDKDVIRYEHIFMRKTHPDLFPRDNLIRMDAEEIRDLLSPMVDKVISSWREVLSDSDLPWGRKDNNWKIKLLGKIIVKIGRKMTPIRLMHVENLVEQGYLSTNVVQDYQFMRRLKETGVVIPGEQNRDMKVPRLYKLNWNLFTEEDDG